MALAFNGKGKPHPSLASVAKQQGKYVARLIDGQQRRKNCSVHPFAIGILADLATVGRSSAVAYIAGVQLSGCFAWILWSHCAPVRVLTSFRSKITVMLNWLWLYLTFQRGMRLITGPMKITPPTALARPFCERHQEGKLSHKLPSLDTNERYYSPPEPTENESPRPMRHIFAMRNSGLRSIANRNSYWRPNSLCTTSPPHRCSVRPKSNVGSPQSCWQESDAPYDLHLRRFSRGSGLVRAQNLDGQRRYQLPVRRFDPCRESRATRYLERSPRPQRREPSPSPAWHYGIRLAKPVSPGVRFIVNSLVLLGLIGTVLGFVNALSGVDLSTISDVQSHWSNGVQVEGKNVDGKWTRRSSCAVLSLWLTINDHMPVKRGGPGWLHDLVALGEANARTRFAH